MNEHVQQLVDDFRQTAPCRTLMSRVLNGDRLIEVTAAPPTGAALALTVLLTGFQDWALLLLPGPEEAEELAEDLDAFGCERILLFPRLESEPGEDSAADEAALAERMQVLQALLDARGHGVILTSPGALRQPVADRDGLEASILEVTVGAETAPEHITGWLADNGFEPRPQVSFPGEYSLRGGILDVFSHGTRTPVRIEFFGDEVDSIRQFDQNTQISQRKIERTRLMTPSGWESATSHAQATLFDYLPHSALIAEIEPEAARDRALLFADDPLMPRNGGPLPHTDDVFRVAEMRQTLRFTRTRTAGREAVSLDMSQEDALGPDAESSIQELSDICDRFGNVLVFCQLEAEERRLLELLRDFDRHAVAEKLRFVVDRLNHTLLIPETSWALIPHHRLFHRYRQRRVIPQVRGGESVSSFLDLRPGDYVVHVQHGVGRFKGVETLSRDTQEKDYLLIEYAGKSLLYVPGDRTELVQKYVGAGGRVPPLSSLHTKAWIKRTEQVREAIEELAADLLDLHAARATLEGFAFPEDSEWEKEFAAEFPYEETPDQLRAIEDVLRDMRASQPMDRLICGDVGYGKTEVAMRAAFKAVMAGKQVAVLVPTTILAQQHFKTFTERMADYPVTIEMLSRFRTGAETREVLARLAEGQVDIIIGTHRLVQKDVVLKDLGLLIIDEEQRFGVEHKQRLKRMRRNVDVLTLSATPIPRTLHMALTGLRDISSLHTAPQDRMAVETRLWTFDPPRVRHAVLREMQREGQVFFVHNRVQDIEPVADRLRSHVPEARIATAHGQMHERELQEIMNSFMEGQIDVLVCTTIIENGVDIPNANTMFIDQADHFGLAELHQLRGRVGRYRNKAYTYLLVPERRPMTPEAEQRLQTIRDYSDLGSGFYIAMRDLEIRGAGNILGAEQSGHIAAIGYELYCELLQKAVKRLRDEPVIEHPEVTVSLRIRALLPDDYVTSPAHKIAIYRKVSRARTLQEVRAVETELRDRFGPLPQEARQLMLETEVRVMAGRLAVTALNRIDNEIWLKMTRPDRVLPRMDDSRVPVRLVDANTVVVKLPPGSRDPAGSAELIRKLLKKPFDAVTNEVS